MTANDTSEYADWTHERLVEALGDLNFSIKQLHGYPLVDVRAGRQMDLASLRVVVEKTSHHLATLAGLTAR